MTTCTICDGRHEVESAPFADGQVEMLPCPECWPEPSQRAAAVVWGIVNDMSDRSGLGDAWDAIDADIQQEIVDVWTTYVLRAIHAERA